MFLFVYGKNRDVVFIFSDIHLSVFYDSGLSGTGFVSRCAAVVAASYLYGQTVNRFEAY